MNKCNKQRILAITALLILYVTSGCTPRVVTGNNRSYLGVDEMMAKSGGYTALKDEPAKIHFEQLSKLFADNRQKELHLNVYALAAPPADPEKYLEQRAEDLEIREGRAFYPDSNIEPALRSEQPGMTQAVGLRNKEYELSVNLQSGSEMFVSSERFHNGAGISPDKLQPEPFYFQRANEYIGKRLTTVIGGVRLYPYKVRKYMDANAKEGGKPTVTVSQVAVAYNTTIDGFAVIGAGDKAVVHMSPEGGILAHESTILPIDRAIARIGGEDLIDPRKAITITETRLKERGIKLDEYTLTRSEFGYYRVGRNGIQRVLAPYYAFVYEPINEKVIGRKIFEIVPAINDPKIAQLVEQDRQLDQQRKARITELAGRPDERPTR
jgi:hypothetical protein